MVAQGARSAGGCRRRKAAHSDGTKKKKKSAPSCRFAAAAKPVALFRKFSTTFQQYIHNILCSTFRLIPTYCKSRIDFALSED